VLEHVSPAHMTDGNTIFLDDLRSRIPKGARVAIENAQPAPNANPPWQSFDAEEALTSRPVGSPMGRA